MPVKGRSQARNISRGQGSSALPSPPSDWTAGSSGSSTCGLSISSFTTSYTPHTPRVVLQFQASIGHSAPKLAMQGVRCLSARRRLMQITSSHLLQQQHRVSTLPACNRTQEVLQSRLQLCRRTRWGFDCSCRADCSSGICDAVQRCLCNYPVTYCLTDTRRQPAASGTCFSLRSYRAVRKL